MIRTKLQAGLPQERPSDKLKRRGSSSSVATAVRVSSVRSSNGGESKARKASNADVGSAAVTAAAKAFGILKQAGTEANVKKNGKQKESLSR